MDHAVLAGLTPTPTIDPSRPDRLVYAGTRHGYAVEIAVGADGRATLRLTARRAPQLRFVTRAQLPAPTLVTGDAGFDAAVGILGDIDGLLGVGQASRDRVRAWLSHPGAWCSDASVGCGPVAPEALPRLIAHARAFLDGFVEPDLATLITERGSVSAALRARIDARVSAEINAANDLDAILDAMVAVEPETRLHWLTACIARLSRRGARALPLLPDPAPPAFDHLLYAWRAEAPALAPRIAEILADPARARALVEQCANDPEAVADLSDRLPNDAIVGAWFEGIDPQNATARRARLEALAIRPPGDPLALRSDLRASNAALRARAGEIVAEHLPAWLADPAHATAVLRDLGLGDSHGWQFIEMTQQHRDPRLIAALGAHRFDDVALEVRRLEALKDLPLTAGFPVGELLGSGDRRVRAAAGGMVRRHLALWLSDEKTSAGLVRVVPHDPEFAAHVIETCRNTQCPGAVRLLASIPTRNEADRLAVIEAMANTGSAFAERHMLLWMDLGYRVRLACIEALAAVGRRAALKVLQDVASGFLVERTLKETALRSIAAIEARLGGGSGALSLASSDGRLSLPTDD